MKIIDKLSKPHKNAFSVMKVKKKSSRKGNDRRKTFKLPHEQQRFLELSTREMNVYKLVKKVNDVKRERWRQKTLMLARKKSC